MGFREWFLFRVATLGFDFFILIFMMLLLIVSALAMGGHVRLMQASVILPALVAVAAIAIRARRSGADWKSEAGLILRDWVPFVFVVFLYENLHDVAGPDHGLRHRGASYRADVALLGFEPTIAAQRSTRRWSRTSSRSATRCTSSNRCSSCFCSRCGTGDASSATWRWRSRSRSCSASAGYVFLPASPPRYFIEALFTDPARLHGLFIFDRLQGTWDHLSVIAGGAFPSLHVGLSSVALIYAYRLRNVSRTFRTIFYVYIPLVLCLWFSTIYLRHHWLVDIMAGWAVAAAGVVGAELLMRAWKRLRVRYGLAS